jgi:hypothetical protein
MLIPILLLLQKPAEGIERFHAFIARNKSFSVQVVVQSDRLKIPGKGTLVISRPSSFRLNMAWGFYDYNLIKNATGSLEYEYSTKTYQEFLDSPGLTYEPSPFSDFQSDSMPEVLLRGNLLSFVPKGVTYKLIQERNGSGTYTAIWNGNRGTGKITALIGKDGRLERFDFYVQTPMGALHRVTDFKNYVLKPKLQASTFATIPPLGFTTYNMPYFWPQVEIGMKPTFGTWKSAAGPQNLDSVVRGKLVILREKDSSPANGLVAYLQSHKPSVSTVILSLDSSGGQYWAPSPKIAAQLRSAGTPLSLLIGKDGKVQAMWLGFDEEEPEVLLAEINKAAAGQ